MSTHDDDILDFDFYDEAEGATRETQREGGTEPRGAPRRGGPRRPSLRGSGLAPLLRLIGLIAFAILIVVLLVVWAQGCSTDRKRNDYSAYMGDIGAVGSDSARTGKDLADLLTTPGLKQTELETKLNGLIQQAALDVTKAQELDPPGPVHQANDGAIQALQMRVSCMQGMLVTFRATKSSKDAAEAGRQLAARASRLTASDVVWQDFFRVPAQTALTQEDIAGVAVPQSVFVENPELYSSRSLTAIWQRIHGASTGGTPSGLHGTGLAGVKVIPSGQLLSTTSETTIQVSTDLGFEVSVTNTGDNQEVKIKVTLTIPNEPQPIVKNGTIDLIDPGETKTVTFREFPRVPFGEKVSVKVDVKPVPGETNTANNTAEYPVIFSLGG